jgi:glycerol-3-phosphate acyltransferase PlsY
VYLTLLFAIIIAYLLGSTPFGLLIAKANGKDLRSIGSGNIGATNVSRALGRKWAYLCFWLDVLKGFIPTLAIFFLVKPLTAQLQADRILMLWLWLAVGCAAILGHIFPIYLKFRGGKGVATSFGVALGLWPYYTFCAIVAITIWIVLVLTLRYVSLASIIASISFPLALITAILSVSSWNLADLWPLLIASTIIPLMVIIRHRENIKRLIAGTEGKIQRKKN